MVKTKRPPQGEQRALCRPLRRLCALAAAAGTGDSLLFSSPPQAPFFAALRAAAVCPNGSPLYAGLFELR